MTDVAKFVVLILGSLVAVLSLWGIYAPGRLLAMVQGVMRRSAGLDVAVIARVLLGAALILAAAGSKFPTVFQVLGWLTLAAAVGLLFVGRERLARFVDWFDRFSPLLIRLWLLLGIAFGVFLVYGVI